MARIYVPTAFIFKNSDFSVQYAIFGIKFYHAEFYAFGYNHKIDNIDLADNTTFIGFQNIAISLTGAPSKGIYLTSLIDMLDNAPAFSNPRIKGTTAITVLRDGNISNTSYQLFATKRNHKYDTSNGFWVLGYNFCQFFSGSEFSNISQQFRLANYNYNTGSDVYTITVNSLGQVERSISVTTPFDLMYSVGENELVALLPKSPIPQLAVPEGTALLYAPKALDFIFCAKSMLACQAVVNKAIVAPEICSIFNCMSEAQAQIVIPSVLAPICPFTETYFELIAPKSDVEVNQSNYSCVDKSIIEVKAFKDNKAILALAEQSNIFSKIQPQTIVINGRGCLATVYYHIKLQCFNGGTTQIYLNDMPQNKPIYLDLLPSEKGSRYVIDVFIHELDTLLVYLPLSMGTVRLHCSRINKLRLQSDAEQVIIDGDVKNFFLNRSSVCREPIIFSDVHKIYYSRCTENLSEFLGLDNVSDDKMKEFIGEDKRGVFKITRI